MNRVLTRTPFILLISLCSWLVSCSTLNSDLLSKAVKKPEVSIETIDVSGLSLDSIDLLLTMNVENPNGFALALAGYDYDVKFNGMSLVKGTTNQKFRVAAHQTDLVKVPISVSFDDVKKIYGSMGEGNELSYDANVDVRLDVPVLNLFTINTNKQGALSLPRFPTISFENIRIKQFSFSDIELALDMSVDNPNNFAMNLKDVVYNISVGGRQWLSGSLEENLAIGEKQLSNISIPLKVKISQLSTSLISALRGGDFSDFSVDGSFTLDSTHEALNNIKVPINWQ